MKIENIEYIPFARNDVNRKKFSCGVADLDDYFRTRLSQDIKRGATKCFVAVERGAKPPRDPLGFVTLSSCSIEKSDVPGFRNLPRYEKLGVTLIGRLARDVRTRGIGLGEALLMEALRRIYLATNKLTIGNLGVIVDAKDEGAERFYCRYGFVALKASTGYPRRFFLPIGTINALFE